MVCVWFDISDEQELKMKSTIHAGTSRDDTKVLVVIASPMTGLASTQIEIPAHKALALAVELINAANVALEQDANGS